MSTPNPFADIFGVDDSQAEFQQPDTEVTAEPVQSEPVNPFYEVFADQPPAPEPVAPPVVEEERNTIANLWAGLRERAVGLVGDTAGFAQTAGQNMERAAGAYDWVPQLGGFVNRSDDWLDWEYLNAEEWAEYSQKGGEQLLRDVQDTLKNVDYGFESTAGENWEKMKQTPEFLDKVQALAAFSLETGVISLADMAGAVLTPAPYLVARGEEMAQERAAQDGRAGQVSSQDLAIGTTASAIITAMERLGFESIASAFIKGGTRPQNMLKGFIGEGTTEFVQEQLEYGVETAGTKASEGMTNREYMENSLERGFQGFAGGGPVGAIGGALAPPNRGQQEIVADEVYSLEENENAVQMELTRFDQEQGLMRQFEEQEQAEQARIDERSQALTRESQEMDAIDKPYKSAVHAELALQKLEKEYGQPVNLKAYPSVDGWRLDRPGKARIKTKMYEQQTAKAEVEARRAGLAEDPRESEIEVTEVQPDEQVDMIEDIEVTEAEEIEITPVIDVTEDVDEEIEMEGGVPTTEERLQEFRGKLEGKSHKALKDIAREGSIKQAGTKDELLDRIMNVRDLFENVGKKYKTERQIVDAVESGALSKDDVYRWSEAVAGSLSTGKEQTHTSATRIARWLNANMGKGKGPELMTDADWADYRADRDAKKEAKRRADLEAQEFDMETFEGREGDRIRRMDLATTEAEIDEIMAEQEADRDGRPEDYYPRAADFSVVRRNEIRQQAFEAQKAADRKAGIELPGSFDLYKNVAPESKQFGYDLIEASEQSAVDEDAREIDGVTIEYEPFGKNGIQINNIEADVTGEGKGSRAMDKLTEIADKNQVALMLEPNASPGGLTQDQLEAWYRRRGFEPMPQFEGMVMRKPVSRGTEETQTDTTPVVEPETAAEQIQTPSLMQMAQQIEGPVDTVTDAEKAESTEEVESTGKASDAAAIWRTARPEFANLVLSHKPGDPRGDYTAFHYYGEITGTKDKDGMPIDVILNKDFNAKHKTPVFVMNQTDPMTGEFIQHKVIAGFYNPNDARRGHIEQFGDERMGDLVRMPANEFALWLKEGDHQNPVNDKAWKKKIREIRKGQQKAGQAKFFEETAQKTVNYSEAQKKRMRATRQPDPATDDLVTYLRKLGGLNMDNQSDIPAGRLKHLNQEVRMVGVPGIEQTGTDERGEPKGLTISQAAEAATEAGYLMPDMETGNYSEQDFVDLMFEAETAPQWSMQNTQQAELEAEAYYQEQIEREAAEAPQQAPSVAPEHQGRGVSDMELDEIVTTFEETAQRMDQDGWQMHHLFDQPKKGEIVRVEKKAEVTSETVPVLDADGNQVYHTKKSMKGKPKMMRVYKREKGWLTPEEAQEEIQRWKDNAESQQELGNKVVISLFDKTGVWSQPYRDAGYDVYMFDIDGVWGDIEHEGEMINPGDVKNFSVQFFNELFGAFEGRDVYAILAACPCTDFASSGSKHFEAKDADGRTVRSVELVQQALATIEFFRPAVWAIENPVGRIQKLGGLPHWRLSFDPYHFGEDYTKKTLIWGRFNADLPIAPTEPVKGSKMHSEYGGGSIATKDARSETPEGFAYAFFHANNSQDHPIMEAQNIYDRLDPELIKAAMENGATLEDIKDTVDDYYWQELDDDGANDALRDLADDLSVREDTPQLEFNYAVDPGEKDMETRQARADAEKVVETMIGQGKLIANGIDKDFQERGMVALEGQRVTNIKDLAEIAEVYRNPSFETFRLFFMQGDTIVGQVGISSRMPGVVAMFKDNLHANERFFEWNRQMRELNADGYYLLHNHPSGNPSPSDPDMKMTQRFMRKLPGYRDHVIINGNTFAAIGKETDKDAVPIIKKREPVDSYTLGENPAIPSPLLGRKVRSPAAIEQIAQELKGDDATIQLIGRSRDVVRGIASFPVADIENTTAIKMLAMLRQFMRQTGSMDVAAVNVPGNNGTIRGLMNVAVRKGALLDWMTREGDSARMDGLQQETQTPPGTKPMDVREAPTDMAGVLEASVMPATEETVDMENVMITAEDGDTRVSMNAKWWQQAIDDRLSKLNKLRGCA